MIHRHWFAEINQFKKPVTVQTSAHANFIIRAHHVLNLMCKIFHCSRNSVSEIRSAKCMPFLGFLRSEAIEIQITVFFSEQLNAYLILFIVGTTSSLNFAISSSTFGPQQSLHPTSTQSVTETRRIFGPRVLQTCSTHFVTCAPMGDTTIHK